MTKGTHFPTEKLHVNSCNHNLPWVHYGAYSVWLYTYECVIGKMLQLTDFHGHYEIATYNVKILVNK